MAERPADRRTKDFGIMMRASAMIRINSIGAIGAASASGVPGIGNQHVDRNAFRCFGQIGKRHQHLDAIDFFFTHAENAATADFHAGLPDVFERVEPIGKFAGRDDLRVITLRGIDIVIVVVEPRRAETVRLLAVQHAQRHAGLETELFHRTDHFNDGIHVPRLGIAPCGAHAVARRAAFLGLARLGDDLFDLHQLGSRKAGRMMRRLAAIAAILGATAGLDVEKLAQLHAIGIEMLPVNGLRFEQEVVEWQLVKRPGHLAGPGR